MCVHVCAYKCAYVCACVHACVNVNRFSKRPYMDKHNDKDTLFDTIRITMYGMNVNIVNYDTMILFCS